MSGRGSVKCLGEGQSNVCEGVSKLSGGERGGCQPNVCLCLVTYLAKYLYFANCIIIILLCSYPEPVAFFVP